MKVGNKYKVLLLASMTLKDLEDYEWYLAEVAGLGS